MSSLKDNFKKQFGNPSGLLGYLAGLIMAFKNRERIGWAVDVLNVKDKDNILEIGCGPGVAVKQIAKLSVTAHTTAIDQSPVMISMASSFNKKNIRNRKAEFYVGQLADLNLPKGIYNKIFAINVSLFWKDPLKELSAIKKHLDPKKGRLYIFHQPPLTKDSDITEQFTHKTVKLLKEAGFKNITVTYKDLKPVKAVCISSTIY